MIILNLLKLALSVLIWSAVAGTALALVYVAGINAVIAIPFALIAAVYIRSSEKIKGLIASIILGCILAAAVIYLKQNGMPR